MENSGVYYSHARRTHLSACVRETSPR
jgi:hypothetical protein